MTGRLLLFDLGYFRYQLFDAIGRQGGYFLTRLKQNANPEIIALRCADLVSPRRMFQAESSGR